MNAPHIAAAVLILASLALFAWAACLAWGKDGEGP